jgi:hypothetical protein
LKKLEGVGNYGKRKGYAVWRSRERGGSRKVRTLTLWVIVSYLGYVWFGVVRG